MTTPTLSSLNRRHALALLGSGLGLAGAHHALAAGTAASAAWDAVTKEARGQTVYFNAWAGAEPINAYIRWAGQQVQERFGVRVEHVKISDAADVVKRVKSEIAAGKTDGTVDLVWINGANFLAMKREGLLYGPFAATLPHYALVDLQGKPTTRLDFAEPVDGMEVPWGMAQLTFLVDSQRTPKPPQNIQELQAFAKANPGRVSYTRPPDFNGSTLLKQFLLDLNPAREAFYKPVTPEAFAKAAAPLWNYMDSLNPSLWRAGKQFANNAAATRQMLADGELLWALTFNPNDAANEIAAGRMQSSVISYQFAGGTIGNTHFVAIPVNARAKAGAQLFANFLLSPEAQARKADISLWGDPTVLDLAKLGAKDQALFTAKTAPGQVHNAAPALPEPHGSWMEPLEKEWLRRYGA